MTTDLTHQEDALERPLRIQGALDISTSPAVARSLVERLDTATDLSVDLSETGACDAAGLQLLIAARKSVQSKGGTFVITAVAAGVGNACTALGLSRRELGLPEDR